MCGRNVRQSAGVRPRRAPEEQCPATLAPQDYFTRRRCGCATWWPFTLPSARSTCARAPHRQTSRAAIISGAYSTAIAKMTIEAGHAETASAVALVSNRSAPEAKFFLVNPSRKLPVVGDEEMEPHQALMRCHTRGPANCVVCRCAVLTPAPTPMSTDDSRWPS